MDALSTKNLTKKYDGFTLDNINLSLKKGRVLGLVGGNGAGKSTTLNLIMNTIKASSGDVEILGVDNTSSKFTDIKQSIGVVLDNAYFPEVLTIKDINKIMKGIYKFWNEATFFSYINEFGLPLNKKFKDFSKGMKMKLSIAVCLSHNAKLLILDEATGGLDPMAREEIIDIFAKYVNDTDNSIIMSSHIVSDLEKICDDIAFIHKGKLLLNESKEVIYKEYGVIKVLKNDFESIDKNAIINYKINGDSIEVLIFKEKLTNSHYEIITPTLEEVILLMTKEGVK
ncbi:MAG: ABC transporter [Epulopiscium sp. Nuni2H_MBin003]|nr:MAG: ABC transporter [Epulopiscium sp. Nuni2H_MBin003]